MAAKRLLILCVLVALSSLTGCRMFCDRHYPCQPQCQCMPQCGCYPPQGNYAPPPPPPQPQASNWGSSGQCCCPVPVSRQ